MKKSDLNKFAKRYFLGNILAAALFLSLQNAAIASDKVKLNNSSIDTSAANKLEIRYVGSFANNVEFEVDYLNLKGNAFSFIIKDENGEVLFEKMYNDRQFQKKIQIEKLEDIKRLSITIIPENERVQYYKEIEIKTRYVEDVFVKIN